MAKKRPYSYQYQARGVPRRYLLSGIPPTLWEKARAKARREGRALRPVILGLLEAWVDGEAAPIEPRPADLPGGRALPG